MTGKVDTVGKMKLLVVDGLFRGSLFSEDFIVGAEVLPDCFDFNIGVSQILSGVLDAKEIAKFRVLRVLS